VKTSGLSAGPDVFDLTLDGDPIERQDRQGHQQSDAELQDYRGVPEHF
jgi:hypothetical protein